MKTHNPQMRPDGRFHEDDDPIVELSGPDIPWWINHPDEDEQRGCECELDWNCGCGRWGGEAPIDVLNTWWSDEHP